MEHPQWRYMLHMERCDAKCESPLGALQRVQLFWCGLNIETWHLTTSYDTIWWLSKTFQNYPKWFSYYACWFSSFRVTGCFPFTALHLACASAMSTRCQELAAETLLQSMRTGQLSCFTNQVPNNKRGLPHTTHFRVMPPPSQKQWLDFFAGLPQIQCV